jgi:hypothetical protein
MSCSAGNVSLGGRNQCIFGERYSRGNHLPPSPADQAHSLGQRPMSRDFAHERFADIQRHPALYWGNRSDAEQALLTIDSEVTDSGGLAGITTIFGQRFGTTGVLGVSRDSYGNMQRRGFPSWSTIPSPQWLAMGRRWHFFFAWLFVVNGFIYVLYSLVSRHLTRDLLPSGHELRGIGRSIADHLLFRHPRGEAARGYNVLQSTLVDGGKIGPLLIEKRGCMQVLT